MSVTTKLVFTVDIPKDSQLSAVAINQIEHWLQQVIQTPAAAPLPKLPVSANVLPPAPFNLADYPVAASSFTPPACGTVNLPMQPFPAAMQTPSWESPGGQNAYSEVPVEDEQETDHEAPLNADGTKPKRKRRTKAEMEAFRAQQAAAAAHTIDAAKQAGLIPERATPPAAPGPERVETMQILPAPNTWFSPGMPGYAKLAAAPGPERVETMQVPPAPPIHNPATNTWVLPGMPGYAELAAALHAPAPAPAPAPAETNTHGTPPSLPEVVEIVEVVELPATAPTMTLEEFGAAVAQIQQKKPGAFFRAAVKEQWFTKEAVPAHERVRILEQMARDPL